MTGLFRHYIYNFEVNGQTLSMQCPWKLIYIYWIQISLHETDTLMSVQSFLPNNDRKCCGSNNCTLTQNLQEVQGWGKPFLKTCVTLISLSTMLSTYSTKIYAVVYVGFLQWVYKFVWPPNVVRTQFAMILTKVVTNWPHKNSFVLQNQYYNLSFDLQTSENFSSLTLAVTIQCMVV